MASEMKMRFFSREWENGELDDIAWEKVYTDYQAHIEQLTGAVGSSVREFANTKSLHDAWLDGLSIRPRQGEVELSLITGDNQVGYWLSTLTYRQAKFSDGDLEQVRRTFDRREAEVRYDEFDVQYIAGSQTFVHRFSLWPQECGGFAIEFGSFNVDDQPLIKREYTNRSRPFVTIDD